MKDKVLTLCRRLKKSTLNELSAFMEADEKVIETILLYLEQEGLIQNNNGVIIDGIMERNGIEKIRS